MTRNGDWMQTATGRQFWPLDPRPDEIHIEDIAAGLSKLCRYGGHTRRFYSVAEHCVLMANAAPEGLALAALLHDASEAYLSDVIRPIKRHLTGYAAIEAALERAIAERFGLTWPHPPEVKRLDERIIQDEKAQAMMPSPAYDPCCEPVPALGVTLHFWEPDRAESEFFDAFQQYRYLAMWKTIKRLFGSEQPTTRNDSGGCLHPCAEDSDSRYRCACHAKMGNDFWFLPTGSCLYSRDSK